MFLKRQKRQQSPSLSRKEPHLELTRLLKLLHVALSFERAPSGEKDILKLAIDVFFPVREPCYSVIMDDFPPLARYVWLRDRHPFADIDCDILRTDTELP